MKTNSSCNWAVSVLLMGAVILASATGVQSQSAADVQNAIGILTDTSNSPQERIDAARDLAVLGQDSDSAAQALTGVLSSDPNPAVRSAAAVGDRFRRLPVRISHSGIDPGAELRQQPGGPPGGGEGIGGHRRGLRVGTSGA